MRTVGLSRPDSMCARPTDIANLLKNTHEFRVSYIKVPFLQKHKGYFGTDLVILNCGSRMRTASPRPNFHTTPASPLHLFSLKASRVDGVGLYCVCTTPEEDGTPTSDSTCIRPK
ncbi:hypothetical protein AVEN_124319-1 [Araneus ventricosus]|uniref:Uncharacterized protein n=1 Tax=Araneus ventricosus TaxID=182803 RepID=A0A4Y2MUZ6_ARAVE|nr:hypothetical protein AVEN_124319-1 [Araneus ventricosus]